MQNPDGGNKQIEDALAKLQKDLKQGATKVKGEAAKAKKVVEDLKQKLKR